MPVLCTLDVLEAASNWDNLPVTTTVYRAISPMIQLYRHKYWISLSPPLCLTYSYSYPSRGVTPRERIDGFHVTSRDHKMPLNSRCHFFDSRNG